MNIINEILEPNNFYHIYNRGINGCEIYNNEENYLFFLNKFSKYLIEYVDVYAYCLMPNHFHFVIKIKEFQTGNFVKVLNFDKVENEKGLHSKDSIISKQIGKFISSYSQAFNKVNQRSGPLLESPFKRKKINSEDYLKNVILYVHLNSEDLGKSYSNYKFSSFLGIVSNLKTNIAREECISLFNDLENFKYSHKFPPKLDFNF